MRSLPFAPPRRPINFSGKACGLQGHWQRLFSALSISKPCKRPPLAFACFLIKLPLCGPTERERDFSQLLQTAFPIYINIFLSAQSPLTFFYSSPRPSQTNNVDLARKRREREERRKEERDAKAKFVRYKNRVVNLIYAIYVYPAK